MRKYIVRILRWQAERFIARNKPKIVVVVGSIGKTSTTQAIATVLGQSFSVRKTIKNYNTDIGVPCSIFGRQFPSNVRNPLGWLWIVARNQLSLFIDGSCDVLVLELGTDSPGDIVGFSWLKPDIAIVTAVAPEHMEFFKTIEKVAEEELAAADYSEKTIVNKGMVASKYLKYASTEELYNYSRDELEHLGLNPCDLQVIGDHSLDAAAAAIAVGKDIGMSDDKIREGAKLIRPQPGRMNRLLGIKDTILIDDSYNASPEAVKAALDYLQGVKAPQRIALLGNMNELGQSSRDEHIKLGEYCDPKKLDLIVTLGPDSNAHTAIAARANGCLVIESSSPYQAANIIKDHLKSDALILLKGSQNGVFAEEATKSLLANGDDRAQLVRQSAQWLAVKQKCFKEKDRA